MSYVIRATSRGFNRVVYLVKTSSLAPQDRWSPAVAAAARLTPEEAVSAMLELQREDYPSWRMEIVWVDP